MQLPALISFRWLAATFVALIPAIWLPLMSYSQDEPKPVEKKAEVPARDDGRLTVDWTKDLKWRSIGPANMGGRIVALSVYEKDPSTWWVATASGGLLKTTNNGITFEHQFDHEETVSIGDVCVAPSDPKIVWVGTGENNPRNSVSYGNGMYKSVDGGKSWTHSGLTRTFQIGRIAIHPTNPDIVYVGALGRLYGTNEERGLFKTTDGGKTWEKVWYHDEKTGVIEVQMHPTKPDELLIASWERQRDGFDTNDPAKRFGEGAGLFKTTDGGKNWKQITKGLPTCKLGRIGLDYYRKNPKVVFAIVDSEKIGQGPKNVVLNDAYMGITGGNAVNGASLTRVTPNGPADQAGLQVGDVITEVDGKAIRNYNDLIAQIRAHKGGDKVKMKRRRNDKEEIIDFTYGKRPQRGGRGNRPFGGMLGGQRENMQARQGPDGFQYGGIYKSTDGGDTWTRVNSLNPRPMYFSQIRVDPTDEKIVYVCGISLYRSADGGKTFRPDAGRGTHPDHHALWIDPKDGRHMILGNDGGFYVTYDRGRVWDHHNDFAIGQFYHVAVDPRPNYNVYGGLQDNGSWGGPSLTRNISGPVNADWFRIGGGDGFQCQVDPNDPDQVYFASQNGNLQRRNLRKRTGASIRRQLPRGMRPRFNWNTPYILSNHNSSIYYCAGNVVFRSLKKGDNLEVISPEITHTKRGSATALAESPRNPGILYVGTDDGALWITRDSGANWTDITKNVGLEGPRWVSSIEASRSVDGRAYVVFDGHRSDDDRPLVYVTEDFGKTWKPLLGNLPQYGTSRVLREDLSNPNLLYLGTEFAIWYSLDRGQHWHKLNNNLPTVAIHEIAQHPTVGEIVVATHGRSLWVLDVTPLRQFALKDLWENPQLYAPRKVIQWQPKPTRGRTTRRFVGQNPYSGAEIYYTLPGEARKVRVKILNADGKVLRELRASTSMGLNKVTWNLTAGGRQGGRPGGRPGRPVRGRTVKPGTYGVVLNVDGEEQTQVLRIEHDPTLPASVIAEQEGGERFEMEEEEEGEEDQEQ